MECLDPNAAVEFMEGSLSPEAAGQVERHMAQCVECRTLIAELVKSGTMALAYVETAPTPEDEGNAHTALAFVTPAPGSGSVTGQLLSQGTDVGRYVILKRLGLGGMGIVYAAYDPKLDRKVALKFIRSRAARGIGDDGAQARLVREAQAIARLSHPNVVSVYDVGTFDDQVYIAMEFVDGVTLTDWSRWRHRSWQEVVELFTSAGKGLAAAHAAGIVHRDFKPDNVIVGTDARVRVMDFGLARADADPEEVAEILAAREQARASTFETSLTQTGAVLGTPRYMAPEQFAGDTADARSDQFSFCVALHESLYGTHPFRAGTALVLSRGASSEGELLPTPDGVQVPAWLRAAVQRGIHPDPAQRWGSIQALLTEFRVNSTAPPPRARWALAAAVVVVAAVGGMAYSRVSSEESAREQLLLAGQERDRLARDEISQIRDDRDQLQSLLDGERAASVRRMRQLEIEIARKNAKLAALEPPLAAARAIQSRPVKSAPPYAEALDQRVVQRRLARSRSAIVRCYDKGQGANSGLSGWVTTEFTIDPEGAVLWVTTRGLRDDDVAQCVREVIRSVRFPRSEVATHATYPFFFRSASMEVRAGETSEGSGEAREDPLGILCDPTDPLCGLN